MAYDGPEIYHKGVIEQKSHKRGGGAVFCSQAPTSANLQYIAEQTQFCAKLMKPMTLHFITSAEL